MEDRKPYTLIARLRRWLQPVGRDEQYLAAATDAADLEHRIRTLDRGLAGPPFVTFNH